MLLLKAIIWHSHIFGVILGLSLETVRVCQWLQWRMHYVVACLKGVVAHYHTLV